MSRVSRPSGDAGARGSAGPRGKAPGRCLVHGCGTGRAALISSRTATSRISSRAMSRCMMLQSVTGQCPQPTHANLPRHAAHGAAGRAAPEWSIPSNDEYHSEHRKVEHSTTFQKRPPLTPPDTIYLASQQSTKVCAGRV